MDDSEAMDRAITLASGVRTRTSPNPWVGCVLVTRDGAVFEGATAPPGGPHAEVEALAAAGPRTRGATVFTTLEPCSHHGRTPPSADALIDAGVARVVVGITDPDPHVAGQGLARLRQAGIATEVGLRADAVAAQLAAYLTHRRTGRPYVVLKLAATLDGRTAAPDGSSQWITGSEARADAHRLRAESDAVLVGAGTVRADDPSLTVRHIDADHQPLRVVLGHAAPDAKVQPALELDGDLGDVLDTLGSKGVLQVLVEGGASVAGAFHRSGLVDRYVVYLAPALFGGDDGRPLFVGPGSPTIADVWRGEVVEVRRLGGDIRIDLIESDLMFTGIVEELGRVAHRDGMKLRVAATTVTEGAAIGDSIAVNGCCLTVVALGEGWWEADVTDESYARTNLGDLGAGDPVNLERPVRPQDRLGGHIVQGHVDAVGEVVDPAPELRIRMPQELLRYVVAKGSIAVDGISLTVVEPTEDGFTVAVIPHTAAVTTLGSAGPGHRVNLEVDIMAKHVERLMAAHLGPGGPT